MRIYDGVLLNDELDLLELRLMELAGHVDRFVVVEAAHDWQQRPKPLHFQDNRARFARWTDQIDSIVLRAGFDYWIDGPPAIEWPQRRAIFRGMEALDMTDYMVFGDVDEIPSRNFIKALRAQRPAQAVVARQRLFYYSVNCLQQQAWHGTIAMPRGLGDHDLQQLRDTRNRLPACPGGGWHFAYCGSADQIAHKLSCATTEFDAKRYGSTLPKIPRPDELEFIEQCRQTGEDLFARDDDYAAKSFVPVVPDGYEHPVTIEAWLNEHPGYYLSVEPVAS